MSYKLLINSYVSTMRKAAPETHAETSAPAAAPTPPGESPSPDFPSEGDPEENG
jgi:hypothetical protein